MSKKIQNFNWDINLHVHRKFKNNTMKMVYLKHTMGVEKVRLKRIKIDKNLMRFFNIELVL